MKAARDGQKQKLYDAENILRRVYRNSVEAGNPVVELSGVTLTLPPEAKFGSIESLQRYVDRVTQMASVTAQFGNRGKVAVKERASSSQAHYQANTIHVHSGRDNWAMSELVVLHELAHHYTLDSWEHGAHGPTFAANFIDLVGLVMGPEAGLALRIIFDQNDIKTAIKA